MAIKIHYDRQDDIFTIYNSEYKPSETIEFSEFLNLDINKDKNIVGMEIFYASEFFSLLNDLITKNILESVKDVSIECNNYRNNWLINLVFDNGGSKIKVQMPPFKNSDYTSPLIANCN
ncbi:MAG TPA: DUF2283 domain-containing protein [Candidatus Pacearchaeota archaeon]|nr:DUF2283 domain-containing protein [Candidatus Pacearchaeota archaeon]